MTVKDLYGKMVDIDIPADVFPSQEEIADIDALSAGCQHGFYKSVSKNDGGDGEGVDLHYRYWLPKGGKPKGIMIYTHGIHSHSGHGSRIDGRALDVFALSASVFLPLSVAL
ncbi:MAG: hypothetical protein SGARI_007184 [Bacillariaceae sp.]